MAGLSFDAVSLQVVPALRARDVLASEIAIGGSGKSSDIARASLVEIELAIRNAEADYAAGSYRSALAGFRRARGRSAASLSAASSGSGTPTPGHPGWAA